MNADMTQKKPRDTKTLDTNGFRIHIELYDSMIIIKDESGNSMSITKKEPLSLILNLKGKFVSN